MPVDGNVERVVTRLFAVEEELPAAKPEIHRLAQTLAPDARAGDFAQALMDLGATICTPVKPACALCPWMDDCAARRRGDPQTFPRKAPKREGRLRRGAAFVAVRADGCVLLRSRPPKGLLGGMTEVPTTEWSHDFDDKNALTTRAAPVARRAEMATPAGRGHACVHAFPAGACRLCRQVPRGAGAPDGARWIAIDALAGRGAAQRHAQGAGACAGGATGIERFGRTRQRASAHFALMLAALITFAHFSPSARICLAKSSGVPPTRSRPSGENFSFDSGSAMIVVDLLVEQRDDLLRRSRRHQRADPAVALHAREAGRRDGRHLRHR